MKEIILTQGKVTQVDDEDYDYLNQWKWSYHKGYANCTSTKILNRIMSRVILQRKIGHNNFEIVDHQDLNKLNNQKYNLRPVTKQQNNINRYKKINTYNKYKGLYFDKRRNKYITRITLNGKTTYIGSFNTQEEAAEAYNKKAIELFGEYAKLNEIKKV